MSDAAPVALYVHWPYCARICPYCDFNVVRDRGRTAQQAALVDAMLIDMQTQRDAMGPRRLASIFFGGGTPSLMNPEAAGRIVEAARRLFPSDEPAEVTLEANPTDAEADRFRGFADAGVQRLSLGVQSLDDASLRFLGRNHDAAEARRAIEAARLAFPRLSLDLIYALPGQTALAWAEQLQSAVDLGPEHVSPYQLTIEQGTAFERAVGRGAFLPADDDLAADLYETAQTVLERSGFHAYEVSNHARGPEARSRHNLEIWRGAEYLGVGPGAHGRVSLGGVRTATRGARAIADYIRRVETTGSGWDDVEPLDAMSGAEERLLLGLRIEEGVPLAQVSALGLHPADERVASLAELGLLRVDDDRLKATPAGRLVLDSVIAALARR